MTIKETQNTLKTPDSKTKNLIDILARKTKIPAKYCVSILDLLNQGSTIPFIARYRKEASGNAKDSQLRHFQEIRDYTLKLLERKEEVARLISERAFLTDKIRTKLDTADTLTMVEDIFRPFKEKKNSRAQKALKAGLNPIAVLIKSAHLSMDALKKEAVKYINKSKDLNSIEDVLEGAKDILAEKFSDNPDQRARLRTTLLNYSVIQTKQTSTFDPHGPYSSYACYSEKTSTLRAHRFLAIMRGQREKQLSMKFIWDKEKVIDNIKKYNIPKTGSTSADLLLDAYKDGLKRLLIPSLEREIISLLKEKADIQAISVFEKNLEQLLMTPGIKGKNILALDPGFKTGCKLAVIDKTGKVLDHGVMYPVAPFNDFKNSALICKNMIKKYNLKIAALGNGTASRETHEFINKIIETFSLDFKCVIVSEAGASVYSASKTAELEFPDLDVTIRGAVSIGRRLLDPMAELIKIDPQSLGIGQYQHDVNQAVLTRKLHAVTEKTVNAVGVDLNTCSAELLSHVAGIGAAAAAKIITWRNKKGKFSDRFELLKVPGIGKKAFEQCAGFLRIKKGNNPLDNTGIHPENYKTALYLQKNYSIEKIDEDVISQLSAKLKIGLPTLEDIIKELSKPGFDIRDLFQAAVFSGIRNIKDLKPETFVSGVVRNIVDFGAFVDIGLKNDALIHISEISNERISHPLDILCLNQFLPAIRVISVNTDSNRVSLSLK